MSRSKETERRSGTPRRGYWRGGRRRGDWPESVKTPPACPRCGSTEVKFVEATPTTLFWQCHGCRHDWASRLDGAVLDAE
jgi:ribosomal protein L37AE/L43A